MMTAEARRATLPFLLINRLALLIYLCGVIEFLQRGSLFFSMQKPAALEKLCRWL
jgi:hypothetical protein